MENRAEREYVELEEAVRGGAMIFRKGRNFGRGEFGWGTAGVGGGVGSF